MRSITYSYVDGTLENQFSDLGLQFATDLLLFFMCTVLVYKLLFRWTNYRMPVLPLLLSANVVRCSRQASYSFFVFVNKICEIWLNWVSFNCLKVTIFLKRESWAILKLKTSIFIFCKLQHPDWNGVKMVRRIHLLIWLKHFETQVLNT